MTVHNVSLTSEIGSQPPRSEFSKTQPNNWLKVLQLSEALTGLTFHHKDPLEGKIHSCGFDKPPVGQVRIPEGAVEWLLHEVAHYFVAESDEELHPNHGLQTVKPAVAELREWSAFAIQQAVFEPWGPVHLMVPPPHRGGLCYSTSRFPSAAIKIADRQFGKGNPSLEYLRVIFGPWAKWEISNRPGSDPFAEQRHDNWQVNLNCYSA